ncbi:hypothetical protein FOXG_00087 [Fusarium oxysporum f. sp. lycopersici 4287]|uniref:C2H2 type master regulator of conidiophore development brlA n=3 Tax=Fusarium oxysporum TaxID=5507 RepID=A0A0J9U439_FUSO4|nr:hypothetical protein FOXG_00087 [Fusarium oxysporum f. sp. lycopersici 4287]XP_018231699.1 hypothetical protein FOXG_00087 [Fusarium oxysporum f. sp. lycopersici 4287]EXK47258.1 hypothetical protein FOMG_00732 [Fusarium oxysporum f. sp. melonis 26406]KAJ9429232.1 hypothetical protein QL093DRAFT_2155788 [Fusarium oxysporum]EXK47259.1 hypothetical protein FOMG_00732 [Fusarium oxysporum f. sp. melonis 26406]KNA93652.1 hypothetical protein FOXG_00087 [Fusarium oxysporum f. sp. lycopersici 4287]
MTMHAINAAGRRVSLLNDETASQQQQQQQQPTQRPPLSFHSHSSYAFTQSYPTPGSSSSSPNTPELLRSDSYDSQMSNDPLSPLTPNVDYYPRQQVMYTIPQDYNMEAKHAQYADSTRSASYDAEMVSQPRSSPMPERPGKRYPCRYRDTHGCEKTFTTSGHASRHSKIHTAEKAVQCTFAGCQKKFTRADNMKQHLETHFKDKSRSSTSQRSHRTSLADARRNSTSGRPSASRTSSSRSRRDADPYPLPTPPLASPSVNSGSWELGGRNLPILNRPVAGRTPSGLDALAMAVACQEGSGV